MKIRLYKRDKKPWHTPEVELPDFEFPPPFIVEGTTIFVYWNDDEYIQVEYVWTIRDPNITVTHFLPEGEDYIALCGTDLRDVGIGSGETRWKWITCPMCHAKKP